MARRTWIERTLDLWREAKAAPSPGALYDAPRSGAWSGRSGPMTWSGWPDRGGTGDGLSGSGAARRVEPTRQALQSVSVYACCQAIAGEISAARLLVKRRIGDEGEEDVENHPLERIWESPNPHFGRGALLAYWTWSLLLTGEAYLYFLPRNGALAEIWPVPPWSIEPIPHPDKFIDGFAYRVSDHQRLRIDNRYICYSRLTNPLDPRRGLSPLVAALASVQSEIAMRRWNLNFFGKGNAAPLGVITVPRDTLDGDLEIIRQQIWDYFGSGERRVGVVRAGDMAWTAFDRSQKDMEFLAGLQEARVSINRVFGIPDGYWDKDATRANAEGAKATMLEAAVWPKLVLLAEDLNAQIAPRWLGDPDLRIAFEDVRLRNVAQELQQLGAYREFLTINELRRLAGYDQLPDWRGYLLLSEATRGAPMPATVPAMLAEREARAADTAAAAGQAATLEPAPPAPAPAPAGEGAPMDGEELTEPETDEVQAELKRWERKALKALKTGKRPDVPFESQILLIGEQRRIRDRLARATTAAEVKAAFRPAPAEEIELRIDAAMDEALRWARVVLADV